MAQSWFDRYQRRQADLARGVDSSLVRANRRRGNTGILLLTASLLVGWALSRTTVPWGLDWLIRTVLVIGALSGVILLKWAQQERIHLEKPDPEKPPSILRRD
jgi:hypothetical protein